MTSTDRPRSRFAFLIHPRTDLAAEVALLHPALGLVPSSVYEAGFRLPLKPWVHATIRAADRPDEPFGEVILVPLTPRQLLGPDRALVQHRIDDAVAFAARRGAQLVGLGALTAPATGGGARLRRRTDVGVTNGNAYTAAATIRAIRRIAGGMTGRPVVALVGATGSVGTAVARGLARSGAAAELLLVGRTPASLAALAGDLGSQARWSTELTDCRRADIVVLMTSAPDALLGSAHLKRGAVVLDDTQPRNTSPALLRERPDVTVIDGGLVETPGLIRTGVSMGIPAGHSFACLAETALLALGGHRGHGTLGRPTVDQVDVVDRLATAHADLGFQLASPTCFGRPVAVPGWNVPSRVDLRSEAVA